MKAKANTMLSNQVGMPPPGRAGAAGAPGVDRGGARRRRVVDDLRSDHHDGIANARLGRDVIGKDFERNKTGLQRVRRNDERIHSLVSAPKELTSANRMSS